MANSTYYDQTIQEKAKRSRDTAEYVARLQEKLAIANPDEWYQKLTREHFTENDKGQELMRWYGRSLAAVLNSAYAQSTEVPHQWYDWRFQKADVPRGYWQQREHQALYLQVEGETLGVRELADWYKVAPSALLTGGGKSLFFKIYNGSLIKCLRAVYPDHPWQDFLFVNTKVRRGFWTTPQHRRDYILWLAKSMNISAPEDWYALDKHKFLRSGGQSFLIHCYDGSLVKALREAYPGHDWLEWKLPVLMSRGFWESPDNQRRYIEWAAGQLGVKALDDWYQHTADSLARLGGATLMTNYYSNSLRACLKAVYPEHAWFDMKFTRQNSSQDGGASQKFAP